MSVQLNGDIYAARLAYATRLLANGCELNLAGAEAFDAGFVAGYMAAKADAEAALQKALADVRW